ncbi:sirohydrochlorin chelatase [Streptomyces sp. NPDC059740]|uniref:sirohydrochlorin chelatase n=1 Tax=Streptomyces sp. NPDC059740 TaxID=3346926 RepID=UPI00365F0A19
MTTPPDAPPLPPALLVVADVDDRQEVSVPGWVRGTPPPPTGRAPDADAPTGRQAFADFVRRLAADHPELRVTGLLATDGRAALESAVTGLVDQGVRRVVTVPLTLAGTAARLGGEDGEAQRLAHAALRSQARTAPGFRYVCRPALGPHPALLRLLERRLDQVLGGTGRSLRERAQTTVLLVGRGSADPDENAEVFRAARLLWEGRGFAGVETAFVSLTGPDVPTGLDRCLRLGARRVVVLPYELLDGRHSERTRLQAEGWAAAHPDADVRCAGSMGLGEEVAQAVLATYRAALAGGLAEGRPPEVFTPGPAEAPHPVAPRSGGGAGAHPGAEAPVPVAEDGGSFFPGS